MCETELHIFFHVNPRCGVNRHSFVSLNGVDDIFFQNCMMPQESEAAIWMEMLGISFMN